MIRNSLVLLGLRGRLLFTNLVAILQSPLHAYEGLYITNKLYRNWNFWQLLNNLENFTKHNSKMSEGIHPRKFFQPFPFISTYFYFFYLFPFICHLFLFVYFYFHFFFFNTLSHFYHQLIFRIFNFKMSVAGHIVFVNNLPHFVFLNVSFHFESPWCLTI